MLMGNESSFKKFISNYECETLNKDKLQLKEICTKNDKKIIIPDLNIFNEYRKDLESIIKTYTMTNNEKIKWSYNPKLLSYELYGTTEFWFLILSINELQSATEFNINPIKIFDTSLPNILGRVMNLEMESIAENNDYIQQKTLNRK